MRILLALAAVLLPGLAGASGLSSGPCPPLGSRRALDCLLDSSGSLRAVLYESTDGATQDIVVHEPSVPPRTLISARAHSFRDVSPQLLAQLGGPATFEPSPTPLPMNPLRPVPAGLPPGARVIERTYDSLDRIETETVPLENGSTATIRYSYYPDGRRRTVTDALGRVTFYEYDGRGNLQRVTTNQGLPDEHVVTYDYWPDNLLRSITRPNGTVTSYDYDRADRLRSVVVRLASSVLLSHEYTYDANGNRLTQVETNGGAPETTTYTYDDLNRLSSVTYPDDTSATYSYDAVGNRIGEVLRDAAGVVTSDKTAVFDPINRLSSITDAVDPSQNATLTYDSNGNLRTKTNPAGTESYDYDTRDLLVETRSGAAVSGRYAYDAFGRRYLKYGLEGARQYLYDETSTLHELSETGLEVAKYEYGGSSLLSFVRSDEPRRFHHQDALGSVVALSDSSGSVVARYHLDAWGRYRVPSELSASANRFGFTGYLFDQETDLYYAKARFYDPEIGRFITQDSVLGQVDEPPSLHRYAYGFANPLRYVDPTGHAPVDMQAAADREAARVAAIRAKRGSGFFGTNQGQGAGNRPRVQDNDTELADILRQLGPDERRRFALAQSKAGLAQTAQEDGQLGATGDDALNARIAAIQYAQADVRSATRSFGEHGGTALRIVGSVTAYGTAEDVGQAAGFDPDTLERIDGFSQGIGVAAVLLPVVSARPARVIGELAEDATDGARAASHATGRIGVSDVSGQVSDGSRIASYAEVGSPAHRAARWEEYQERGGTWSEERWNNVYAQNVDRARAASRATDTYHQRLGWGRRELTVDVEGVPRKLDIGDVARRRGVEHKTGYQTATQENLWEVQRDQVLLEQGWDIRWQFDGRASKPLIKALDDAGIPHNLTR